MDESRQTRVGGAVMGVARIRRWWLVKRGKLCPVCAYDGPTACPDWWEPLLDFDEIRAGARDLAEHRRQARADDRAMLRQLGESDWWEQCPCGCDIPMSHPDYPRLHGANDPHNNPGEAVTYIWPCDHGGVRVETNIPPNYKCAECGAKPKAFVPADTARALEKERDEIAEAEVAQRYRADRATEDCLEAEARAIAVEKELIETAAGLRARAETAERRVRELEEAMKDG